MHIGLLSADLTPSHGWGQYNINLAQSLTRAGVEVCLVTPKNSPAIESSAIQNLLPNLVPREPAMPLKLWLSQRKVRNALSDCQLIHATVEPFALLADWCARERPYLITGHGSYVNTLLKLSGIRGDLYRRAFTNSARVICVSKFTESQLHRLLPGVPSCAIPNGVNGERFASLSKDTIEVRTPTVLAVGAVKPRKGILPLVEAIAVVKQSIPDLQCVVIGETSSHPHYVAQVRRFIEEHSLQESVRLLGAVDEAKLIASYSSADLFCLPTLQINDEYEGYGQVYLEAGLAGLPVIATDAGGASDVVKDGETGILLPKNDMAKLLPVAIVNLMKDKVLAKKLGAGGREQALALSWDHIAQRYIQVYEEELSGAN